MTNIFLDTQVFIQQNYGFKNGLLNKVVKDAEKGLIKVYLTEVVKREVESKIHSQVYEKIKSSYNTIERDGKILKNIPGYENTFRILQQLDTIYSQLIQQFNDFLNDANVTVLSIDDVSATDVFDKYFAKEAPFSGKKKNEFPDAFSLLALEKYFEEKSEMVRVISGDTDLEAYCEASNSLIYEASLQSLNNYLTQSDTYKYGISLSAFNQLKSDIEENLTIYFVGHWFNLIDEDGDVEIIKVNKITIEQEPDIIELNYIEDDKEITASISANAVIDFEAIAKYVDYAESAYDKEEGKYIFKKYTSYAFEDVIDIPLTFRIIIDTGNSNINYIIDEINNGYAIDIRLPIEY